MSTLKVNTIQSFIDSRDVIVNDGLGITGSLTVSGTLQPQGAGSSTTADIGTTSARWDGLYVKTADISTNLKVSTVSSSLIPHNDDTYDLGSSLVKWKDLYIDGTANIDDASITGKATIATLKATFVSGNLLPLGSNTYSLGSTAARWNADLSTASINFVSGNLIPVGPGLYGPTASLGSNVAKWDAWLATASIGFVNGNLLPAEDDLYDLGSFSVQWRNLYIDGVGNIDRAFVDSVVVSNTSSLARATVTEITASGIISSSGDLSIGGSEVDFTNLPTSDPGVSGRLYQTASGAMGMTAGKQVVLISA